MKYFLDPFGCVKNQVDAEIMMASLNDALWKAVDDPADADMIIVNSCGFIEVAKRESINAVLAWKKQYPQKKILLAGCLSQRYRKELEESLTEADGFLDCDSIDNVVPTAAELFKLVHNVSVSVKGNSRSALPDSNRGLRPLLGFPGSAYVKISEGCSNNCTFCAIPLIRGPLRCRAISDIVEECKQLLRRGVKELCLIGQDIAAFTSGNGTATENGSTALAALLKAIAALPGDFWVRLLYLHPDHFSLDILDIIAHDKRFLPYFDIPFQHATPHILSSMGRKGNAKSYLGLLETIRTKLPDAVIRSTFLVGFPGETEDDFKELVDFQKKARFDWLGVFTFSREEGTAAYSMKGRVGKKIAAQRKAIIEEKQLPITEERMNRFVGQIMDVLIEEAIDPEDNPATGLWLGRLFCQAPEVDGAAVIRTADATGTLLPKPGDMIRGTIVARNGIDLELLVPA
ncbi:MAG: 30S ribosomal protein S12 methylthiotransferase RimO [Treponema sp.]|nr:30S ribosomal protein S12 methylthiotransferase RimO [Treponema sp.]